jgi:hypothetical protein
MEWCPEEAPGKIAFSKPYGHVGQRRGRRNLYAFRVDCPTKIGGDCVNLLAFDFVVHFIWSSTVDCAFTKCNYCLHSK